MVHTLVFGSSLTPSTVYLFLSTCLKVHSGLVFTLYIVVKIFIIGESRYTIGDIGVGD